MLVKQPSPTMNKVLKTSIIPTEWKMHKIIPIYKSSNKTSVNNYRSISLLCNVSKVLEDLIYAKVLGLVSPLVNLVFIRTLQQLLLYYHQLITFKDEVDIVHIDIRKVFDSVSHSKLLLKLWNIGITDKLWKWFKSYLSDRYLHW